jgi:hypothetical protein
MSLRLKLAALVIGLMSLVGITAAASPALAGEGPKAGNGGVAPQVSCPDNGWSIKDGRTGYFFNGNSINIRTGPSTVCTSVGQGQASHLVQLDCWKWGQDGTWSHLYDFATGKQGWVKDSLLVGYGANVPC